MIRFGSFRPNLENYVSPIQRKIHVCQQIKDSLLSTVKQVKKVIITDKKVHITPILRITSYEQPHGVIIPS